jgi:hypothetical protein
MKTNEGLNCNRRKDLLAGTFTRSLLMNHSVCFAALLAMAVARMSIGAHAQSYQDLKHATSLAQEDPTQEFVVDPYATAGPTIHVTDASGQLATITLGTYSVHRIGHEGVVLTDIGFNPKDGQLYGVSFSAFYRVDRRTGKATYIGPLGISDANALVFDGHGKAYTAGVNHSELYTINLSTGRVSPMRATSPFRSAGDLTFHNGGLVLSGYYQSSLGSNTPDTLVLLNPKTGEPMAYSELKLANLFGIVCTGKNLLFGFAGTSVYELFPSESNIDKRAVFLKDLSGRGLAKIYGAAYDGYFLY